VGSSASFGRTEGKRKQKERRTNKGEGRGGGEEEEEAEEAEEEEEEEEEEVATSVCCAVCKTYVRPGFVINRQHCPFQVSI